MKELQFEKIVYVNNGTHIPYQLKYKQLENELQNDIIIKVQFPQGKYSTHMKRLEKLGYTLKQWDRVPQIGEPIYSLYIGIFEKIQ